MNKTGLRLLALHSWALRILLWLYPAEFRRAFGKEMIQTYRTNAKRVYLHNGARRLLRLWSITVLDVAAGAVREHANTTFDAANRWQRIGGLALTGGGLLWAGLHLPFGVGWFQIPPIAMALLLLGLASMQYQWTQKAGARYALPLRTQLTMHWLGFMLAAVGLLSVMGGYLAAWRGGWVQTGLATAAGAALQCAGLLLIGMTAHQQSKQWPMMLLAGLVCGGEALWLAVFLWQGTLMVSVFSVIGLVVFGVMSGLCWVGLGVALWIDGGEEAELSAA